MDTFRQLLNLPISTPGAILTSIGRVDFNQIPAGSCRLAEKQVNEHAPCRIAYAFIKRFKITFLHLIDVQVFNRYQTKLINYLSGFLVTEIMPFIGNPFVNFSNNLPGFSPCCSPFFLLRKFSLRFGKVLFFFPKKQGVDYLGAIRKGSETFKPDIYPNISSDFGNAISGERHEKEAYHLPVLVLLRVQVFIIPSMLRCFLILILPILDNLSLLVLVMSKPT